MNSGIPKNVLFGLAKPLGSEVHPAADLLNAYSERTLSAPEDAQIAGHLANCPDCRTVVFLASAALPGELAAVEAAEVPETRAVWWRWAMPAFALAIVAAVFLAVPKQTSREASTQEAKSITSAPSEQAQPLRQDSRTAETESKIAVKPS